VTWSQPRVAAWLRDGTRPKIAVWTPQQLATFLTVVADDDLYGLWWLAGLRGLRRGELVGLRWLDVDLADATLTVTQTLIELPGAVAESEPKTAAGNRAITLDPATVTVLAEHRRRQQRKYEAHGTTAEETGFVFAWPDGRPIRPGWLTHRFTALVTEHGLPPVRLHDLRHGTAMNALHGSASLHTVQHLLGHSSHAFTADVYGTVPDALARAEARTTAETILAAIRHAEPKDMPEHRVDVRRHRLIGSDSSRAGGDRVGLLVRATCRRTPCCRAEPRTPPSTQQPSKSASSSAGSLSSPVCRRQISTTHKVNLPSETAPGSADERAFFESWWGLPAACGLRLSRRTARHRSRTGCG
jgi:hypothetical protein